MFELCQAVKPKIIIGIPAYNEERYIADVVRKSKQFANEVIVVDDASADNTSEVAALAGALVNRNTVNQGYGACIKKCIDLAKSKDADILVTLDGDGQHDPLDIPILLAPILNREADVVFGSRFHSRKSNMPYYRKFGIHLITFLYNFGSRLKISDAQSGFRAYSRSALTILNIHEKGMAASVEIIKQLSLNHLEIKEVPISCIYHSAGSTINPVKHGLEIVFATIKLHLKYALGKFSSQTKV